MKRCLAFILAILLASTLPLSATATEIELTEQNELFTLACTVFPEYAPIIRGESTSAYSLPRSSNPNEIVHTETRNVSDTHSVGIAILSSGSVIVVEGKYDYTDLQNTGSSISHVGTDTIGYASFKAECTGASGVFNYNNVGFIITQGGSGNFTSRGTVSTSGDLAIGDTSDTTDTTKIWYNLTYDRSQTFDYRIFVTFSLYFDGGKLKATLG